MASMCRQEAIYILLLPNSFVFILFCAIFFANIYFSRQELLATDPSSNREIVAPVDAVFSLGASKHDVIDVKMMDMERSAFYTVVHEVSDYGFL
jgi:hypothetical protein